MLLHLRGEVVRHKQENAGLFPDPESVAMKTLAGVFASPSRFERMQRLGRFGQKFFMRNDVITSLPGYLGGWTAVRDVYPIATPDLPRMVARARAGQGPRGADLEGRSGIMSAAREAMLGKIREALRDVPRAERPEDVAIDRSYRPDDRSPREALIEHFIDRVSEYKAAVRKVAAADLPQPSPRPAPHVG